MTVVSNDPSWWPEIEFYHVGSYCAVASTVAVIYDWALTFEQEFELVWKRRLSLMSIFYLSLRYGGILYSILDVPSNMMSLSVTDAVSTFFAFEQWWIMPIANTILGVIMITRLHAMYQRSRKMLIFLVVIFLAVTIPSAVISVIQSVHLKGEEFVLSGFHVCIFEGTVQLPATITWILGTVWEVLALFLAVWIAVKHFRERPPTGSMIEDTFTVLIKSHIIYFASFVAVACLEMSMLSPNLWNSSVGDQIYYGIVQMSTLMQMFVLGPRLILSVREYNANVVTDSEEAPCVSAIAFQERTYVSNGSSV
ncbi:uncharacterized protein EDB91DRAFT_317917 [Suillus paluster]|uniref:uncharacterized protein n=1 Tax=Suillus paluster TaxID=48578 RepID=UPI001B86E53B|nr:uncharacterized protein EDB91DRAFT_317917 [Suillus paluster]KAG1741866.1 hypothetical protein EDB91DRAFT_317917 [Suillus paluster]